MIVKIAIFRVHRETTSIIFRPPKSVDVPTRFGVCAERLALLESIPFVGVNTAEFILLLGEMKGIIKYCKSCQCQKSRVCKISSANS